MWCSTGNSPLKGEASVTSGCQPHAGPSQPHGGSSAAPSLPDPNWNSPKQLALTAPLVPLGKAWGVFLGETSPFGWVHFPQDSVPAGQGWVELQREEAVSDIRLSGPVCGLG